MKIPRGYRFAPTDEELISYYLARKLRGMDLPPNVFKEVDIYGYTPQQLEEGYGARREKEMYFFTKNKLKYENGSRPTRQARDGFWRASTRKIPIKDDNGHEIGHKMLLNYRINADKKRNTEWLMYEYTIPSNAKKMDGYVLCKIYTKDNKQEVQINAQLEEPHQKIEQQPQPNHGTANCLQQQHLGYENQNVHLHQNVDSQYATGDEVFDLIMEEIATSGSDVQVPEYEPDFHHVDNTVAYLYQQNLPLQVSQSRPNCLPQQEPAYESAAVHDVGYENQYMELSAIMEDELLAAEVLDRTEGSFMKLLMED